MHEEFGFVTFEDVELMWMMMMMEEDIRDCSQHKEYNHYYFEFPEKDLVTI